MFLTIVGSAISLFLMVGFLHLIVKNGLFAASSTIFSKIILPAILIGAIVIAIVWLTFYSGARTVQVLDKSGVTEEVTNEAVHSVIRGTMNYGADTAKGILSSMWDKIEEGSKQYEIDQQKPEVIHENQEILDMPKNAWEKALHHQN